MFGAYDHTNDKIHVQCYKKKAGKQFVDFLKRVEKGTIRTSNIFILLDNLSVHKSKKVREEISKCCPRIKLVFLPVKSRAQLNRSTRVGVTKAVGN